jgi:Mn-containing catalase
MSQKSQKHKYCDTSFGRILASRTWRSMSDGADESIRGPWNQGQGPWPKGMEWEYVDKPLEQWLGGATRRNKGAENNPQGSPAINAEKPFTHEQRTPTT